MDRTGVVAEFAAFASGEYGLDLAEDGEGYCLSGFGADIEADGAEKAGVPFVVYQCTFPFDIVQQALSARVGAEYA